MPHAERFVTCFIAATQVISIVQADIIAGTKWLPTRTHFLWLYQAPDSEKIKSRQMVTCHFYQFFKIDVADVFRHYSLKEKKKERREQCCRF